MEIITARPHRLEDELAQRIGARLQAGERCMVLVPSQETLHTELALMERLAPEGSFDIDVLSPGRLRDRVFERAGRPSRTVFDERGKRMVITGILEREKDSLTVYGRAAENGRESLAAKLSEVIACCKRSGVSAEELRLRAEQAQAPLAGKLADAALVYGRYEEQMAGRLADMEDMLSEVRQRMERSAVVKGQHVFVTGFDMITPDFAEELLCIAKAAASLCLLVESDANGAPDGSLYAPVNASLERLKAAARDHGVSVREVHAERPLEGPEDLAALEARLFALGAESCAGVPEHIRLLAVSTQRREVQLAAAEIRRLAASGVPLEEVAVLYPKATEYPALLASVLPEYGIAAYTAEKRPAASHPLARFLLNALTAKEGASWHMQEVGECIQSGFMPLTAEEGDALCAYCEEMEIRGGAYGRPFVYRDGPDMTEETLAALEDSRQRAAQPLTDLHAALKRAQDADGVIHAVLTLLEETQAAEKLETMAAELEEKGLVSEAQDCRQIWNALMETLDQLHDALGGERVSPETVRSLLTGGLSALKLSALPPAEGAVICGEIGNLRTGRVGNLFVLGMNDRQENAVPGLFSPQERRSIEQDGVYLGMDDREREALSRLDLLKALSAAREHLWVSYALADENGGALQEGEAAQALRRLFPDLPLQTELPGQELIRTACAPGPAAEAVALCLREAAANGEQPGGEIPEVCAALAEAEEGRKMLSVIRRMAAAPQVLHLEPEQARKLYGDGRAAASVSRLETFAACPYRHFVGYGLKPERERGQLVDRAELGTLYHEILQRFVTDAMALPEFPALPEEAVGRLISRAEEDLLSAWRQSPFGESGRGAAYARHIHRTAASASMSVLKQYASDGFVPRSAELVFGEGDLPPLEVELADGTHLYIKGRIDRVDQLTGDGETIRIVDYKSSGKKLDATRVYYGLQLQLMIYMSAALAAIPGSRAGGFFYFHIDDPSINTESRIRSEVEKELARKMALSGVTLADVEVRRANGMERARSGVLEPEQMEALLGFAKRKAGELADQVKDGLIDISPYELPGAVRETACQYCGYAAICAFDPASRPRRVLQKKTLGEVQ